jgi:hypothetical protein
MAVLAVVELVGISTKLALVEALTLVVAVVVQDLLLLLAVLVAVVL